jgi:hypothetical protein
MDTRKAEAMIGDLLFVLLHAPLSDLGVGKGLTRSMHAAALIERTYDAYFNSDKNDERRHSFFGSDELDAIALRLERATLQPEESRFRDILQWKDVDKKRLHGEMRNNFMRLVCEWPEPHGRRGLEMHLVFDLRMCFNADGYESVIEAGVLDRYPDLALMRTMLAAEFPGLRKEEAA